MRLFLVLSCGGYGFFAVSRQPQLSKGDMEGRVGWGSFNPNRPFVGDVAGRPYLCLFLLGGVVLGRYVRKSVSVKTPSGLLSNFVRGVFGVPTDSHDPPSGAPKMPQKVYLLCRHFWHKRGKSGFGGRPRGQF